MWQGLTVTLCLICPHSLGEKTVTGKSQFLCSEKGGFEPMHLQPYFFGRENLMFIIIFFLVFFSFLVKIASLLLLFCYHYYYGYY